MTLGSVLKPVSFIIYGFRILNKYFQNTNRGIKITILLEDEDTLVFSPNFSKIQSEILRMVDSIVNAIKLFPRIEAKIYADICSSNIFLKVYST